MTRIVVGDIGGTHCRLAIAELSEGQRPQVEPMRRYRSRELPGLAAAWAKFAAEEGGELPRDAALGVAAPIEGEMLRFMNNDWRIPRHTIADDLGLDRLTLLNDFGAVSHAVSILGRDELIPLCGSEQLPENGVVTVMGPGTGLGVAILDQRDGAVRIIETEASHIGLSPLDPEEEGLADALVARYGRASVERIVSGPGLIDIHRYLGGGEWDPMKAGELWTAAMRGENAIAARALEIFIRCFAAAAGDIALAQGSMGVAITGGLANRIAPLLRAPAFEARFTAKGRYRDRMQRTAVVLATTEEPGLLGAAVAFQREHKA
ncbi:glucokinase [Sphingosinicella sp.]|uniref:glucokinase n=1 Tax=Sphingosinicella sp. TaxID=1917971 RepID=UPI0040381265